MEPLGLGLVGFGGFGRFCLETYAGMPELRVIGVADIDPQQRLAANRLGFRTFDQAADLLALPEVQIVHVSTPPFTHASLTIAAANMGKHVFCEKPLAIGVADGERMIAAAKENHIQVLVNYVLRYNSLVQRLKDALQQGILGTLHHLSLENWATDEPLKPGHWFWNPEESGGIWIEHGVHFFDLFQYLAGSKPQAIAATSQVRPDGFLDRVWGLLRYSNGVVASFHHAFTQPARIEQTTIRLAGSRGYATLYGWIPTRLEVEALVDEAGLEAFQEWAGQAMIIQNRYAGEQTQGWAFGGPYQAAARVRAAFDLPEGKLEAYRQSIRLAVSDLIQAIQNREVQLRITPRDMLSSLAVAQAATAAAQSGRWESIPPIPG